MGAMVAIPGLARARSEVIASAAHEVHGRWFVVLYVATPELTAGGRGEGRTFAEAHEAAMVELRRGAWRACA
jgi:hypothetical protein